MRKKTVLQKMKMAKVLTFSRQFPSYHPKSGQLTYFIEKIIDSLCDYDNSGYEISNDELLLCAQEISNSIVWDKIHTIRAGIRWKTDDDIDMRYWTGKPYRTKQAKIAQPKALRVASIQITKSKDAMIIHVDGKKLTASQIVEFAHNDGLSLEDMNRWFTKDMIGQIIFWSNKKTSY